MRFYQIRFICTRVVIKSCSLFGTIANDGLSSVNLIVVNDYNHFLQVDLEGVFLNSMHESNLDRKRTELGLAELAESDSH